MLLYYKSSVYWEKCILFPKDFFSVFRTNVQVALHNIKSPHSDYKRQNVTKFEGCTFSTLLEVSSYSLVNGKSSWKKAFLVADVFVTFSFCLGRRSIHDHRQAMKVDGL